MIGQMTFLRSPDKIAGLLFLLAALLMLTIWFQLLVLGPASDLSLADSASHALEQMFSPENPSRLWFVWLAFLPVACAALGTAYLLNLARTRTGSMILFVVSVGLGTTAFVFTQWPLALVVALPCYWGFRCAYRG
jgi:amino acid permease